MNKNTGRTIFSLIAALTAIFLMAAPALAHHKDAHAGGNDRSDDSQTSAEWTEDNDTNDGGTPNNVSDDGDNAHPSGKDRSVENGKSGNQGKATSDPDDDGRGPDRSNGGADKPNGPGGVDKADQDGNNGCGNDDDFEDDNEGWCTGKPKSDSPSTGGNTTTCPSGSHMVNGTCVTKGNDKVKDKVEGSNQGSNEKITICHATGSMTNPFVVITVSVNGLNGHGDHEGDVIPAPADGCTLPANVPAPGGTDAPEVDVDGATPDDEVLGEVIVREDNATPGSPEVAAANERPARVLGGALPFTGASLLTFLGAALGLIGAGLVTLRTRRS